MNPAKPKKNCLNCNSLCKRTEAIYCSLKCQQEFRHSKRVSDYLNGDTTVGLRTTVRRHLLEEQNYSCSRCLLSTWNSLPITLELEHIDGNPHNNKRENLCLLCPNCHSQTPTYKGKNRGNGRISRRERARLDYYRQKLPPTPSGEGLAL